MITEFLLIPGVILIAGGMILPLIPEKLRSTTFLIFPIIALVIVLSRPEGYLITGTLAGMELQLMTVDSLSRLFGIIFAATALIAGIYAWHIKDLGQQSAALIYAGGALGVTFAGDYFSLLIYWELMAVSSTWLVWARRTPAADKAGMRYLIFHVLGGGLLLSGIIWHFSETGSLLIDSLPPAASISSLLILTGVAINAAVIPLHVWLPDAYPKATVTGAVFMSAFTTKSAVYVLIRIFPGWEILIWFGVAMAIYGVLYAVICKDIREILAYHIVSQVGFMVAGIGVGTEMALNGAAAHAYSHILYKSLMFMCAGAVLYAAGTTKLVHLGGLKKRMRWTMIFYLIGGFSISGLPLFNGFISKAMTVSAAGYAHYETAMLLLILAGVGTFLSVGLKLPYFTWFDKEENDIELKPLPLNMYLAMGIAAFLCIFYGLFPNTLYVYLPFAIDYQPYTVYHLVEITQISILTFTGFWLLRKKLTGELILALDFDWFYRKPAPLFREIFVNRLFRVFDWVEIKTYALARKLADAFDNPMTWMNPASDGEYRASTYSPAMGSIMGYILCVILLLGLFIIW
ncbi:MAG: Na(+)/H(+) antiporter subunit D [Balneolaceae bacterium]